MDILRGLLLGLQFFLAKGPQRLAPLSWLSAEQQMIKSVMPKLDAQAEREYHDG